MASGQQLAEENIQRFRAWAASKSDDDFREMAFRGVLSRTEIAAECGFAKSALAQNPRIREEMRTLEDSLRERGVLPRRVAEVTNSPVSPSDLKPNPSARQALDAQRLSRLERENASLRAELAEFKLLLSRFTVLQEALAESGRLPR